MVEKNNELKNLLIDVGLKEKEADVYVAILSLGQGTASQIARKARIARTTVYDILASLFDKGLVTLTGKEPKQEYVAESPDNLKIFMESEVERMKTDLEDAKRDLIPQLKSIHNVGNRPKVMFYEGKEGLEKVYEDTLTSNGEILAYASVDDVSLALPHYFPLYFKRRAAKGIPIRAIFPDSPEARKLQTCDKEELRTSTLVPLQEYGFHPEINIYNDKVMIASWRENLGITIESAEVADVMRKVFKLAWAEAKRLDAESRD